MAVNNAELDMKTERLWDTGANQHITLDRTHLLNIETSAPMKSKQI